MKTQDEAQALLILWGATLSQSERILTGGDENEQQTKINLLFSISDCLQLLVRDETQRNRFMLTKSKETFFAGRKPLEIISSGEMQDLTEVHMRIRNMICI